MKPSLYIVVTLFLNFSATIVLGWDFSLSTFNVYGLKIISPYKAIRMPAIGLALKERNSDVVALQEAWTKQGRKDIVAKSGYKTIYNITPKGTFGSGLMTMTNLPFSSLDFWAFTMDGRVGRFWEGDRLSSKGISRLSVIKEGVAVDVFSLHSLARYKHYMDLEDAYSTDRLTQLFEAFDFMISTRTSDHFLVAGDFNMSSNHIEFQFWNLLTGLTAGTLPPGSGACTFCAPNTFSSVDIGQVDHIFLSPSLNFIDFKRDFEERIPLSKTKHTNLSDHFGLTAKIGLAVNRPLNQPQIQSAVEFLITRLTGHSFDPFKGFDRPLQPGPTQIKKQLEYVVKRLWAYEEALTSEHPVSQEALEIQKNILSYQRLF